MRHSVSEAFSAILRAENCLTHFFPPRSPFMTYYLYAVPIMGVLALFYTAIRANWVSRQDAGDARMTTIAGYIADGAIAFLKAEYKVLALFGLIAGAFLFYLGSTSGNS